MMNLGGGRGVGSMSLAGSDRTRKAGDAESDEFPVGLRVLVVDDDPTCLKILERMLITCRYDVTKCNRVDYALNELRSNKNGFDVVISDVHMPNMDGFKLLEYVGLEMDLPVIMMSADDSKNVVMKGVRHGACDYLTKPVRMDALKNIWQHVVRRKKSEWPELEPLDHKGQRRDTNEENWRSSKRKGDDEEADDKDDYCGFKKQRVVWSVELHQQFVAAVNQLGIDKAVPKKILELMDVPGLTRENVASHLQKYRLCLRKIIDEPHHLGGMTNSYMSAPSAAYGTMSPLGGMDLQTFTAYQPSLLGLPPINLGLSMPIRQTNAFGLESSIARLSELQHLQQLSNANRQSYLLHGNSTAMDPKQLTNLYQYTEPLEMIPPQPRLSTGELVGTIPRNALAENIQGMPYTSVNPTPELSRLIQEDANLPKKRSREFDTDYGLFNELSQQKNQDWLDASSNIGGVQHKSPIGMGNINAASTSVLVDQNQGYRRISMNGNKSMIATGPVVQEGMNTQSGNNLVVEDVYACVKPAEAAQEASSASNHYHFEFDQEDLLSVMLKQQEEVTGAVEGEFDFATLDDILSDRGGCIN